MFKPLSLFVALRYMRAKRRNHFISFITLISVIGIALGVTVLITVLSVMNGFDNEIRSRIFGVARQVTIGNLGGGISDWQGLMERMRKNPSVVAAAPVIDGQGVVTSDSGIVQGAALIGVDPTLEASVSGVPDHMIAGSFANLTPGKFGIVLGAALASSLGVDLGDKITVMVPQATLTPAGLIPRVRLFTVVGIFRVGNGFRFDSQFAFMNLRDAAALNQLGDAVSGIRLKLHDLYQAPALTEQLQKQLGPSYQVLNWTQDYGGFFDAIKLEKTMMFVMLAFIIAVAAFNLVSTLVMSVNDKEADIAILRTIGATQRTILTIFMIQGIFAGLIGTLVGLAGGIVLALNVTSLVNFLEAVFHVQLLSSSIYFVDYLPSQLQLLDVVHVCITALLLSLLATVYPAWRAAKTQPAEALRYE